MRVGRRKNEPADMFALRAFSKVLPEMDIDQFRAFANYVWDRGNAEVQRRNDASQFAALAQSKESKP